MKLLSFIISYEKILSDAGDGVRVHLSLYKHNINDGCHKKRFDDASVNNLACDNKIYWELADGTQVKRIVLLLDIIIQYIYQC